jgi:guanylate kinase
MVNSGKTVIFDIDWKGAQIVRKRARVEVFSIFIMPPSMEELRRRLESRGRDTPEEIEKRLAKAEDEMSHKGEFDAVVINDNLDQVVNEIISLAT